MATIAPPAHNQFTSGVTTTPMTAAPFFVVGAATSVRYTSSKNPPRTDGVPMAWVAKG